jgi:putative tricarboxylic transport membrane protein
MTDDSKGARGGGPAQRSVEIGVAAAVALFALVIIIGSIQAGIGWGAEGPKAGFFPFYIGLLILISTGVNLLQILRARFEGQLFADWGQLRLVLSVLVPTTIYVALIPWIGIYVASALLIAVFMKWLGDYGWGMVAAIAIGVPLVTFVVFEKWFLVPLPKGPLETALGF